jgi:heme exporter protein D
MWYVDLPLVAWLVLGLLAYALVTVVLYVGSLWVGHHLQRHNLAVQIRQRRRELKTQKPQEQEAVSNVEVEG